MNHDIPAVMGVCLFSYCVASLYAEKAAWHSAGCPESFPKNRKPLQGSTVLHCPLLEHAVLRLRRRVTLSTA